MPVTIHNMTKDDLETLAPILSTEFDDFWSVNTLKQELENPHSSYYVAKEKREIVGFAGIWRSIDDVHITDIVTKKTKRRLGIASLLLETLVKEAKKEHFSAITLEVNENNLAAISLYEKYHFLRMGFRKKYYNNKENAIIMTRSLV